MGDCYLSSKTKAMSPSQFHAKKEITSSTTTAANNNINGLLPPPLKINKDSRFIRKSSPPSSSSSSTSSTSSSLINNSVVASNKPPLQQRHPVIIYTHSPRVIHTHPRDFMALVQKLTGLSRSEEDGGSCDLPSQHQAKKELEGNVGKERDQKKVVIIRNEDNETSSVITEENSCSINIVENQVNSCFMGTEAPMLEPPFPYMTNLPMLAPSSADFLCSSQPLLNYSDSLFFSHNMRTSIASSATLEGMKEFGDY